MDIFEDYKYGPRFSSRDYDEKGNVKTIRGTDISSFGDINYNQVPTARIEDTIVENHVLKNGDLIMITTADCGISGVFYEQMIPYIASAYAIKLTPTNNIDSQFIKYFMQSTNAINQVQSFVRKGTVANLPGSDVMHLRLNLPPLPEQIKIAKILSTWDKAITTTEALIDNSKQQKKALMQQLLTGKKRFPGFEGEWKDVSIGDLGTIYSGGTPNTSNKEYWDGGVDWITPTDITKQDNVYINSSVRQISQDGLTNSSAKLVPKGSLLICTRATIGKMAITSHEMCTNQGFKNIVPNKKTNIEFIYYLLTYKKHKLISKASGSTFLEISKSAFESIKIRVSTIDEQQKIASVLINADKEIELLKQQLSDLQQEKKALMQQLLTGKRRVKVDESEAALT